MPNSTLKTGWTRIYLVFVCFGVNYPHPPTPEKTNQKTVKEIMPYIDYSQKRGFRGTKNSITRIEGKGATDMNHVLNEFFLDHLEHDSQSNIAPAP